MHLPLRQALFVLFSLIVFMQVSIVRAARAMEGKAVPPLPGTMSRRIELQKSALVYLYSPQCDGKIAGYHVGAIPSPVMERFDHPTPMELPGL